MLSLSQAHDAVVDLAEPDADPALTPDEVDAAIARTQIASVWVPSTIYSVGQRVIPVTPEGRAFVCVLAGTSGTTEPPWLIAPPYTGPVNPLAGNWWGMGIMPFIENVSSTAWFWGLADNTCAWRMDAVFAGEIYDVRAAAADCWRRKARKAASRVDSSVARGVSARESQLYQMCMDQARAMQSLRLV